MKPPSMTAFKTAEEIIRLCRRSDLRDEYQIAKLIQDAIDRELRQAIPEAAR